VVVFVRNKVFVGEVHESTRLVFCGDFVQMTVQGRKVK